MNYLEVTVPDFANITVSAILHMEEFLSSWITVTFILFYLIFVFAIWIRHVAMRNINKANSCNEPSDS